MEPSILSSPDGHFWSEAVEAIARVERQGTDQHIQIIKTISLIEFLGNPLIFELARVYCKSFPEVDLTAILKDLGAWSSIVYQNTKKPGLFFQEVT